MSLWPNLSWCGGIGNLERRLTILKTMQNMSRRERGLTLRFMAAATISEAAHDIWTGLRVVGAADSNVTNQELEILKKLDPNSGTACELSEVIETRIAHWHRDIGKSGRRIRLLKVWGVVSLILLIISTFGGILTKLRVAFAFVKAPSTRLML